MLTSAERLADLPIEVASERVRRSAAEAVASHVVRNLDRETGADRDQLALPL